MISRKKTLQNLAAADPVMSTLIDRLGHINIQPRRIPPFQSIIQAIIHQQLSGKVAGVIFDRFVSLFDGHGHFPTAEDIRKIDFDIMRSVGLSKSKATYIKGVTEMELRGMIPSLEDCDKLSDEEIKNLLIKIKGVGNWTVEMLLIFNFGRRDVLPIHDLGVRKGFQIAYRKRKLPTPEHLERFGRKWKPNRTLATLYLWRAADLANLDEW